MFNLLPILVTPFVYAALIKLAALLMKRIQLLWRHALVYGFIAIVFGVAATVLNVSLGRPLPWLITAPIGIVVQLAIGGWYLGPRARGASGEAIGFRRGTLVSLVAFAVVFVVGVAAGVLVPAYLHFQQLAASR